MLTTFFGAWFRLRTFLVLEGNMNYNYNQIPNHRHNNNTSKDKKILLFAIVFFIFAIVFSVGMALSHKETKNYFNIPFKYDDLEITVTDIKETDCENGSFSAKITFFVKNISDKTNNFDLDDVYLKNETTNQEYIKTKLFSHENLKAGDSKEYSMEFTIPSSISSEKYLLCFDFADIEAKCALYHENGELLKIESFKIYHDKNIQALSLHFGNNLAENILLGLEGTHILKEKTQLDSEWIIKRTERYFEIYTDFSAIIILNNDQFKILTYETVFDEATAILLYDSTTPNEMKALSEAERENLKSSQRKYQVQNTIRLSPQFGTLLHNQLGQTFCSFTVKNVSDSDIVYMEFEFTLSFPGYTSDFKSHYTSWDEIAIGKSKKFELKTTETKWRNYDFFEITNVVIMFEDGTSIAFDEYDCQFLSD